MLKKIIHFIVSVIDWVMIIAGSCLASYSVMDFHLTSGSIERLKSTGITWGYYYTDQTRILFALGVGLIVFGILLYKSNRK